MKYSSYIEETTNYKGKGKTRLIQTFLVQAQQEKGEELITKTNVRKMTHGNNQI